MNDFLSHLEDLHTTPLGAVRIQKNLNLSTDDIVAWCRAKIQHADSIVQKGKNLYVRTGVILLTIHAQSHTLITARREKAQGGDSMEGVGIIRKLDDIAALKTALIAAYDERSHKQISQYSMLLAQHILSLTHTPPDEAMAQCLAVNQQWQEGKIKFQTARDVADIMLRRAAQEKDPARAKLLRVMAQVAATPHVKRHGLIASDYAIALINVLHPGDWEAVRKERETQIALMNSV